MKLYKITTANEFGKTVHWVASQAEASNYRRLSVESGVLRKNIETVPVDVPTNKEGLLDFLNKECK